VAAAFAVVGTHLWWGVAGAVGFAFTIVGGQVMAALGAIGSAVAAVYAAVWAWRKWITVDNIKKIGRRLICTQLLAAVTALLLACLCSRAREAVSAAGADCGAAGGAPSLEAWLTGLLVAESLFVCIYMGVLYASLTVYGAEVQKAKLAAAAPPSDAGAGAADAAAAAEVPAPDSPVGAADAARAAAEVPAPDSPLDAGSGLMPLLLLLLLVTSFVFVWDIVGFVTVHSTDAACEVGRGWAYALITLSLVQLCFCNIAHSMDVHMRRGGAAEAGEAAVISV